MDEKDIQILKAIGTLKSGSPDKISNETGIPKSTVHYRLEKLQERGILNDVFEFDLENSGFKLTLITEVWADYSPEYHQIVGDKLAAISGVNEVYFTLGDTDFVLISHLTSREMVEKLISKFEEVEEVERTSSKFVITTIKKGTNPFDDYTYDELVSSLVADNQE
ncbi:Lrp/AsnC family transcriptional regulator [Haladaptatus caseinilyticus]|uniref:Lrp/AsnC family transcriptional regulator n=1 Tax=Haladaptatus caseinilyticus TaxID=2993314 RepID=UPI00224ACBBA|nr:Lrp/AsnC family transcriptional regulator [Haladaptatus caseinilyticus]